MTTPLLARENASPVLFVAREPDETLRTFLPVIDCLRERHGLASRVLFHHAPGAWARGELGRRAVLLDEVTLPSVVVPRRLARVAGAPTVDEIARMWRARSLADAALARHQPAAVVVIQDTLLLERFVVRRANQLDLPTLVVQWAFSYPQEMYDRLRVFQYGRGAANGHRSLPRRVLHPISRRAYAGALGVLGLRFDLVQSYGGGEARQFAVMGEAFRDQFKSQGVANKEIVVTGHPTHDVTFRQAQTLDAAQRAEARTQHGIDQDCTLVLYATQPVLWRKVITRETLERNVRAMAEAVSRRPERRLVLKLHPREDPADYAFCTTLDPPVSVIPRTELPALIAASDLFVSSSSSTVLLAMMLDRPIVTVNFDDVPHFDQFEPIGGTIHVRTHEAFADAIERALEDPSIRDDLARQRASVLARYTRFDGRAAERIAGLVASSILQRAGRPVASERM
jgi:glycosyltransferase involved in cell wall biosynthesis